MWPTLLWAVTTSSYSKSPCYNFSYEVTAQYMQKETFVHMSLNSDITSLIMFFETEAKKSMFRRILYLALFHIFVFAKTVLKSSH